MTELVAGLEVGGGGTAFMTLRRACELRLKKRGKNLNNNYELILFFKSFLFFRYSFDSVSVCMLRWWQ